MPPRKKTIKAVEVPKPAAGAQGVPKAQAAQAWSSNFQNAGMSFARRAWYGSTPQDARKDVSQYDRQSLLQKARYAEKNYPSMVQYVNDMVMYVVGDGSKPTSHAADPAKARLYEDYYYRATRKADITGRYTGEQLQRIIVNTWAVDGEVFALKVTDAQGKATTQIIEGHRVVNPTMPNQVTPDTWDGFVFGKYGEVIGIWVQFGEGQYELKKSGTYFHIADFKRASGAHGLPPMAHALNSMQDQTEIIELEKRATKQVTDVPSILTKNGGAIDDSMAADLNGTASSDFGNIGAQMGGKLLVLEPGEDLKSVAPNFPRQSMEMFNAVLARMIAAGGLPYEVVNDGSKAGSALVRMVLGKADRYVGDKQCMLHDCYLIPDWQWRIGSAIAAGELPDDPKWADVEFSVPQSPSIDNGRDSANDREDLRAGLTSFSAIAKKRGGDFRKTFAELVEDILYAKEVTAATSGKVAFEEAMQRFTNMQAPAKEAEESPEDEAEDEAEDEMESGTSAIPDDETNDIPD
jgi:capsid protein